VRQLTLLLLSLAALGGCSKPESTASTAPTASTKPAASATTHDALDRLSFNRRAVDYAVPLFWTIDADKDGALDPAEVAVTWGLNDDTLDRYVKAGAFTPEFDAVHERLRSPVSLEGLSADERVRRETVLLELSQGRPTLVQTRLASPGDVALVGHMEKVARLIERLFARQNGVFGLDARIPADDTPSKAMFFRNQGPFCEAPKTESNPACNALPDKPKKISGLYPAAIQSDPKFCDALQTRKDADTLLDHFVVVRHKDGGRADGNAATDDLVAVPYHVAYAEDMQAISAELRAAAATLAGDPTETAFKAYLEAAAKAFVDNSWFDADLAWKGMTATNSKWFLRVGPDEVYFDPCALKAGFHMSFARINQDSIFWQKKLEPVKSDMEKAVAELAGPPYKARAVDFALPDFIDIVINAGDSRSALGATVGQSLPNWGPVAEAGGRTVAMTNLYTDPDSEASLVETTSALYCKATMDRFDPAPRHQVFSSVMHEAAHNLGPSHEYKVGGKTDDQAFGGPLASTLEELKAQTASLYFPDWLADRGLLDKADAAQSHIRDVVWSFGHIAQGMNDATGRPKAYSQLAAIQMGFLESKGVLVWKPAEKAANGSDVGCFDVDESKWRPAVNDLARIAFGVKARGDRKLAEQTRDAWVSDGTPWAARRQVIQERWLRAPKASFVYAITSE
jgi:hypothetical protein